MVITGTSLGHTDVNNECPSQECTASVGSQAYLRVLQVCPAKSFIRRKSVTFGCSEHREVSSGRVSKRRKKLGRVVQTETVQCVDQTSGTRSADYLRFLAEA